MENVKDKPFLLVFNKSDIGNCLIDKPFMECMFNVNELMKEFPNFISIYCSALTGKSCDNIF